MRKQALAILAVLAGTGVARAEVWENHVIPRPPGAARGLTSASNILYLNDCHPNGCAITRLPRNNPNSNNSILNTSSIPDADATFAPYRHGQAHWDNVVQCVRETFAPFNIQVVTDDPGTTPHHEVIVGGTADDIRPGYMAGGVAPFISCGAARDNTLVFVFANDTSNATYLCGAIAHEAGHAWGLSHCLDARDPMTYLELGSRKHWQNSEPRCGTELANPQQCQCTGATQNSFRELKEAFGLHPNLTAPVLTLARPADGAWVKPGFGISASFDSQLDMLHASIAIDGAQLDTRTTTPLAWNAPALGAGEHTVTVTAVDYGDRTVQATATVRVMATCEGGSGCAAGFHCLGGLCYPGASVDGGLGAACGSNDDCITGACGRSGSTAYCTGTCDAGGSCPSGFACTSSGADGICWPEESGGCATADGSPGLVLFGLGLLAFATRRRRRAAA